MVEDYIPDRIEFDVSAKDKSIKAEAPVELKVDGHFLYGAPASGLQLEGDMLVAPAASGRPGYPGYQFGVADEETASNERTADREPAGDRRQGRGDLPGDARQGADVDPSAGGADLRPHGGDRRPRGRAQAGAAGGASAALIGVKPLFGDKSVAEGDKAEFDVVFVGARRQAACRATACATNC